MTASAERGYLPGGSTTAATMRRTSGSTISKVGKATIQDDAQAVSHRRRKFDGKPKFKTVVMAEITAVMNSERSKGSRSPAYFAGSLRLRTGAVDEYISDFMEDSFSVR